MVVIEGTQHDGAGVDEPVARLSVTRTARDGRVVVGFEGDVDLEDAPRIARELRDAVEAGEDGTVADLRAVTFLGSTGIRLLLEASAHARALGRTLSVELGAGPARRVVRLLELERSLDILDPDPDRGGTGVHIDPAALGSSVEGLEALAAEPAPVEALVERVIQATRELFAVSGVGLMLADDAGALRYVGATDAPARALETIQEEAFEGPCVDCFVHGRVIRSADIGADGRWPRVGPRVSAAGVRAVLGVPTRLGGAPVGSLNVYRAEPYEWDDTDVAAVEAFGAVLEGVLGGAVAARRSDRLVGQLQEALDRRVVIERAVGVLMARRGLDPVSAFGALRREARDARRTVADLAADVLTRGDLPGR